MLAMDLWDATVLYVTYQLRILGLASSEENSIRVMSYEIKALNVKTWNHKTPGRKQRR